MEMLNSPAFYMFVCVSRNLSSWEKVAWRFKQTAELKTTRLLIVFLFSISDISFQCQLFRWWSFWILRCCRTFKCSQGIWTLLLISESEVHKAPVVQRIHFAVHSTNHYPVDSVGGFYQHLSTGRSCAVCGIHPLNNYAQKSEDKLYSKSI